MAERIIFHADDYGANKEISQQILDCCKNGGALNSLSVLPNSPDLEECMELLAPYRERLEISVHLNLAEGPSAADPRQIPWLVDQRGMFAISFLKVLLLSFTGRRRELKRQIRIEMEAQIGRMLPYVNTLRIDSHQHYHMIPIVLESILEVVGGRGSCPAEEEGRCIFRQACCKRWQGIEKNAGNRIYQNPGGAGAAFFETACLLQNLQAGESGKTGSAAYSAPDGQKAACALSGKKRCLFWHSVEWQYGFKAG